MTRKNRGSSRRSVNKNDEDEFNPHENDERESSDEQRVDEKSKKKGGLKGRSMKKKVEGRSYRAAAFQTKCSPSRLKGICDKLNEAQQEVVMDMGFGSLLGFRCTQLDRVLCKELVDSFDVQQHVMHVRGCRIVVTDDDVGLIFGIPCDGFTLPEESSAEAIAELDDVKGLSNKELEGIIGMGNTDNTFRKAFLLYVLSIFLCPTTKESPSPRLFPAVANYFDCSMFNWGQLVLQWLVNELRSYRVKRFSRQSIGGCTFFLMMLYFHRRPVGGITSRFVCPVMNDWDDEKLSKRMRVERKHIEGLLNRIVDEGEKGWVQSKLKYEVTRVVFKRMMVVLKSIDDALMDGKFNLNPFINEEDGVGKDKDKHKHKGKEKEEVKEKTPNEADDEEAGIAVDDTRSEDDVMKEKVYSYCISRVSEDGNEELAGWHMSYITHSEMGDMRPCGWVNSGIIDFAAMVFNLDEEERGLTSRWCLGSVFWAECLLDFKRSKKAASIPLEVAYKSFNVPRDWDWELIFTPICHESHWWCLVMQRTNKKFYVLDSMSHIHRGEKAAVDKFVAYRLLEHLHLNDENVPRPNASDMRFDHISLPKQHNCDDCGVYTIKYMELWDPNATFDGSLSMPVWTEEQVKKIRKELVVGWVLHERNVHKLKILVNAGVIPSSAASREDTNDGQGGDMGIPPSYAIEVYSGPEQKSPIFQPVKLRESTGKPPNVRVNTSSIANRVKDGSHVRIKGRQTRTPYTGIAKKRSKIK